MQTRPLLLAADSLAQKGSPMKEHISHFSTPGASGQHCCGASTQTWLGMDQSRGYLKAKLVNCQEE